MQDSKVAGSQDIVQVLACIQHVVVAVDHCQEYSPHQVYPQQQQVMLEQVCWSWVMVFSSLSPLSSRES